MTPRIVGTLNGYSALLQRPHANPDALSIARAMAVTAVLDSPCRKLDYPLPLLLWVYATKQVFMHSWEN